MEPHTIECNWMEWIRVHGMECNGMESCAWCVSGKPRAARSRPKVSPCRPEGMPRPGQRGVRALVEHRRAWADVRAQPSWTHRKMCYASAFSGRAAFSVLRYFIQVWIPMACNQASSETLSIGCDLPTRSAFQWLATRHLLKYWSLKNGRVQSTKKKWKKGIPNHAYC